MVLANVTALGFRPEDIKIMLSGHAHFDHVAGDALVKARTGAKVFATEGDARLLESGGKEDFRFGGEISFPPVTVDRRLRDGERVSLGATTLTAHLTPGHTKGNTTWTMRVADGARSYDVVFAASMSINPGVRMANYAPYPSIADDYAKSFVFLETLHPDVFLAPHGGMFHLDEKRKLMEQGAATNPFIDHDGYRAYVAALKKAYLAQLAKDRTLP
jgi:metallo-beta-lactamase class B